MPKVSVIVPIFNVEKYLKRCLDSIINQTLQDIEIILVDDESPDNCPIICDDYAKIDSRIKVIHKNNEGLGFARNSGLEIATGQYVAFVDSDDYVDLKMYETLYNVAEKSGYDAIYSGFNIVRKSGKIEIKKQVETFTNLFRRTDIDRFIFDMVGADPLYPSDVKYLMSSCLTLYSTKILKENNLKFSSEREFISEDLLFNIDYLMLAKKIAIDNNSYYYYCYNENSITRSYNKNRFKEQKKIYLEIYRRLIIKYDYDLFRNNLDRLKISHLRGSIKQLIKFRKEINYIKIRHEIKVIVNDDIFKDLIYNYPFERLAFKHKIFFLGLKNNLINLLMLIVYFDLLRKK